MLKIGITPTGDSISMFSFNRVRVSGLYLYGSLQIKLRWQIKSLLSSSGTSRLWSVALYYSLGSSVKYRLCFEPTNNSLSLSSLFLKPSLVLSVNLNLTIIGLGSNCMLSSSYSPSIPGILWVKRRLVMLPLPVTVKVVKLPLSSVNKLSRLLFMNVVCIDITLFFGLSMVSTNNLIASYPLPLSFLVPPL